MCKRNLDMVELSTSLIEVTHETMLAEHDIDLRVYGAVALARSETLSSAMAFNHLGHVEELVQALATGMSLNPDDDMVSLYAGVIASFKKREALLSIQCGFIDSGFEDGDNPPYTKKVYLFFNCYPGFVEYSMGRGEDGNLEISVAAIKGDFCRTPLMTVSSDADGYLIETFEEPAETLTGLTIEECAFQLAIVLKGQFHPATAVI